MGLVSFGWTFMNDRLCVPILQEYTQLHSNTVLKNDINPPSVQWEQSCAGAIFKDRCLLMIIKPHFFFFP